jgi:hypothetical protein
MMDSDMIKTTANANMSRRLFAFGLQQACLLLLLGCGAWLLFMLVIIKQGPMLLSHATVGNGNKKPHYHRQTDAVSTP